MEYGLIGESLGHSFSPWIHKQLGGYDYQLCPLPPQQLEAFLCARDFLGINVTIPYKKAVIPYCRVLSETARSIGSVNTIIRCKDGSLYGDNTDLYGFLTMARRAGVSLRGKKILILGSGGTSLTVQAACRLEQAASVIVISRHGENTYQDLPRHMDAQVLVNTTPVGMFPHNGETLCDLNDFPLLEGVLDVVYNPLRTALLRDAQNRGIPCSCGLPMLVAQAKRAAELFMGHPLEEDRLEPVLNKLFLRQCNVILVGMPGSGKSTLGAMLAKRLDRPFVDIDEEICRETQKSIPAIFEEEGEAAFRALERQMIGRYGAQTGLVIATGGGAVCDPRNEEPLRQNGWIVHLQRPLPLLATAGRPLSQNAEALARLWLQRSPLYEAFSDFTAENTAAPEQTAQMILEAFYEITCD